MDSFILKTVIEIGFRLLNRSIDRFDQKILVHQLVNESFLSNLGAL